MKNDLADKEKEIQNLYHQVAELQQQLDEAQAMLQTLTPSPEANMPAPGAQQIAEELNAILQTLRDPVMVYDQNGVVCMANESAVRAHGFDPIRHHRRDTNQTLKVRYADGRIAHSDELPSARALQGETVVDEALTITNSNGQELSILVSSCPLIVNGIQKGAVSVWHDITERKRTEDALKESEAKYRNLVETAFEGVWVVDTSGHTSFVNRRMAHMLKYDSPDDLMDRSAFDFVPAEDLEEVKANFRTRLIKNSPEQYDVRLRCRDGSMIWASVAANNVLDETGNIIGRMALFMDITERKQAEERLRSARDEAAWLARLPGENPNPVIRVSQTGVALYCNPPAASLRGWRCVLHEPLSRPLRDLVEQAVTQGQPVEQDVAIAEKIYSVSVIPIPGESYLNVYGSDITERKQTEKALAESERRQREITRLLELDQARLAAVLRHLPVGVWIVDEQGRLTGSNPEADRIWAGEAPLLNSPSDYQNYVAWHPETGALLEPEEYPAAVALRTGESVEPMEMNIRRFDGSKGTVLVSAAPIKDLHGMLTGAVGVNVDITERKKTEEALRRSEERFAKAFHATPDAITITRMSDGLIIEVNEGWRKLFGHEPEDVIGKTFIELGIYVNPEDRNKVIERLLEKGFLNNFEIKMRRKSGEIRQINLSMERIEINDMNCLLTIMRDITERKQSEQALRESERRLKRAQEIAHLGSWELDLLTNQLTWSDEVYRIFGLRPQQFAATYEAFLEAVHPEDRAAVDAAYSGSIEAGLESYEIEHRVVKRPNGEVRIVHEKCEHFRDPDGQITRSVGMVHDITERKRAEEALRTSEERFHSLADSMPQLVWTALPDGTVDYYNRRHQEYRAIKPVDGEAWEWAPVLHSEDLQATVEAWMHSVQTGDVYQIEHRVCMADGSFRWHLSRGVPMLDQEGRIIRWFGTATDIHDLKVAEEQLKVYAERLERSNRELEQFAFMASHDLQEPLRKIEMFGDLLLERAAALQDRERNYLDRMRNAAGRMREMVEGLLQLSRVTTQAKSFVPVDLSQVASEVLHDLEGQIRRTGGVVQVSTLPVIEGDPAQLHQLMQNLIGNALKYHRSDSPPDVNVYAELVSGKARICVRDQGIGFAQEEAERIFQPFQRLVGRSQYEGSGIGLAICQRIVERHHGEITVVSQPEQGTTFVVTLPVSHVEVPATSAERI